MEFRLSDDAETDLVDIYDDGLQRWGFDQAIKFQLEINKKFERLAQFPYSGTSAVHQIWPGLRRAEIPPYIIFYMPRPYGVFVARIVPGRMAIKAASIRRAMSSTD